ncbi:DUF5703 family protein [Zafaria sp. Z1313]|uniref:DUF5703 family protein n=1 Tax=unclassified Zafaria TaxID=2828765 RepID=UPI002E772B2D|nr:DUF5703 family protein [Zafaria sp. J156]MEE1621222.1 DUF5703 family protein [Zafaria sp. J156]
MRKLPTPTAQLVRDPREPFEYLVVTVQPGQSLSDARQSLVDYAEYGKWELKRSSSYFGGMRRFWLRRKVMRVERTLPPA